MKVSQLIEEIESNPELATLKVHFRGKAFQVYPWLKGRYFHKFVVGEESLATKNTRLLLQQIASFFYGFWNIFKRYDAWGFSNSQERVLVDGKYYDKLFDGFTELNNYKIFLIELQLFAKYPRRNLVSPYVISKAFFMLQEEVYSRLFLRKIKLENEALIQFLEEKTGVQIDAKAAVKKYLAQYAVMRFWLKIVKRPKLVFTTVSYTNFGYIYAFHERHIPVVELQHGVISSGHQAYTYCQKMDELAFPDAVGVWGKNEWDFLQNETLFPAKTIVQLGRPIVEMFAAKAIQNDAIQRICVSLQDGAIGDNLIQTLLLLDKRFPARFNFDLQRRRTTESDYRNRFAFPANFHFFEGSIYENIAQSDLHITAFSTSAIESLAIGKAVIFVDNSRKAEEVFASLLQTNKFCFLVKNEVELAQTLNTFPLPKNEIVRQESSDLIAMNYTQNLENLIQQMSK